MKSVRLLKITMNILVINGPNLNLLGERESDIYGYETLDELMYWLSNHDECKDVNFEFYQSNHEGKIIDKIHEKRKWFNAIIINPGALTHYSYAIRDCLLAVGVTSIEVHLSDIAKREAFRKKSVISDVCFRSLNGRGKISYLDAVKIIKNR